MKKQDILIFFSDQHTAMYNGFAGHKIVETPNLDRIANEGTVFDAAYTTCPLCVPARMSWLSGQLPSRTGIYTNNGALPEDQATFIHSLAAEGYETVLCGRMHFKGEDQRHGFTKRIMDDITVLHNGNHAKFSEEQGPYQGTLGMGGCVDLIGGGNSPVLEYDRAVIKAALEYLTEDHEKPQCIVVGTYAPHFPYVAPPDLYEYYREQVELPDTYQNEVNYQQPLVSDKEQRERNSVLSKQKEKVDEDTILRARAAYFGMITNLDRQIGDVYQAWQEYLERRQKQGLFIYMSDHGDTCGEHYIFGKQTFYEGSARIPLLFAGDGIKKKNQIEEPVSIMDIGPTLCEMTGAITPPEQDGMSLLDEIVDNDKKEALKQNKEVENEDGSQIVGPETKVVSERYVYSEFMETDEEVNYVPGRMVRKGDWKYIAYAGWDEADLLFNLKDDPSELNNVLEENTDLATELKQLINKDWYPEKMVKKHRITLQHHRILSKWGQVVQPEEEERWQIPEDARKLPVT